jgi:hypothetical protein
MQYIFALLFVTVIGLTNCDNYKEIKGEDLKNAFILNSSPTFKGYYFQGSDSAFHYFVSRWNFRKDRYFKIASGNLKVIRDFKFNTGSKELMISLSKENSEEFAENKFYKLYAVNAKQ